MAKSLFNMNTGLHTIFADSVSTQILRSSRGIITCMGSDFGDMGLLNGVDIVDLDGRVVSNTTTLGIHTGQISSLNTRMGTAESTLGIHTGQIG